MKLEAWQAVVSPKLGCCTEPTSKASGLTVGPSVVYVKIALGNAVQIMLSWMVECLTHSLNVQLAYVSTFEVSMRK